MNKYIKQYESLDSFSHGMRLPKEIALTSDEINQVKRIDWKQLGWEDIGNDGNKIVWLDLISPFNDKIKSGIIVDIQLVNEHIYQIHISLAKPLRDMGLGFKIYRSLIDWTGHLYSGKGRRQNLLVNRIWKKLADQPGVTCISSKLGDICISDKNPDKEILSSIFSKIG